MLKDIQIIDDRKVVMHKKLWDDQALALAKCFWFDIDTTMSTITADLEMTTKTSLLEFFNVAFPRIMTHPSEEAFKNGLLMTIDKIYLDMIHAFSINMLPQLGYQDKLYSHQTEALFEMRNKRAILLAFEMGTGKTKISGSVSKMHKIRRTIIICPSIVKWNWFNDLADDITGFNPMYFTILDSKESKTIKAFQERFVIVNFESAEKHMKHILSLPIGHVIVDEAHGVKNHNSKRYKILKHILDHNPEARVTLATGTPIKNRVNDMFAYLKLVKHPLGENYTQFLRDYTISQKGRGSQTKITGAKNTNDLWVKMSNFMLRKKLEDCVDLPDKIYNRLYFDLDDYSDEYDNAVREALENSGKTQLSSSIHTINIVTAKSKLNGIIEMAENILESGEKVTIFSSYKEPLNILRDHFKDRCVLIDGSVPSHERGVLVEKFKTDENCTVFLGNMAAAGVGINLVSSSNMILTNFPLTPSELYQTIARLHRIGQKKKVNIWYTICRNTIDENLFNLIAQKAMDANAVVDNTNIDTEYTNIQDVLFKELREKYNIQEVRDEATEVEVNE